MRRAKSLRFAAMAVLAAGAALMGPVQPASAGPDTAAEPQTVVTGPIYRFGTSRAMAILNASTVHAAAMIQYEYSSAAPHNDRMVLEKESTSDVYRIKPLHTYSHDGNVHNDKCLAVQGNALGNNIPIVNANCTYDSVNNDVWYETVIYIATGNRLVVEYRNQATGKCITSQNGSTANNVRLITFTCEGNENDLWVRQWT